MKQLICLSLTLVSFFSVAQTDSTVFKLKKCLWSIEGHMQQCYRIANNNMITISHLETYDSADQPTYTEQSYNPKNDTWGFGYGAGIYGNARLYKRCRLQFGLEYDHFQYGTKTIDVLYSKSKSIWGTSTGQYINSVRVNYELRSISLLLKVHHYFKIGDRTFLNAGAGFSLGVRARESITRTYLKPEYWKYTIENNRRHPGFLHFSFGVNYFITSRVSLFFEPYFKTQTLNFAMRANTTDNVGRYSIGAKTGFTF